MPVSGLKNSDSRRSGADVCQKNPAVVPVQRLVTPRGSLRESLRGARVLCRPGGAAREAERARIKKLKKENELVSLNARAVLEDRASWKTKLGTDELEQDSRKDSLSSCNQFPIQDPSWFMLNPQEKLIWAKSSKDPRVAAGQQSPLEKEILNLGGVRTRATRQLIIQKYQEEYEAVSREKAHSLDYWLARAESYYNTRRMETMKEQESGNGVRKKMKGKITHSTETQKMYYMLPEREMNHIERHIRQAEQARKVKNKTSRQILQPPREIITFPSVMPEEHGIQYAQMRKQVNERNRMQIKDHQMRMIQGRKLTAQKFKEEDFRQRQSQPLKQEKKETVKEEMKDFESIVAYPLFQPYRNLIKVNILVEKSQIQEDNRSTKPYQRKFLTMPPFLRSRVEKMKDQ